MKASYQYKVIQYTCSALLIGRAVQHLFYDSPVRGILYSPLFMKPTLQLVNIPFNDYINSPDLDTNVNSFLHGYGFIFLLSGIAFFFFHRLHKRYQKALVYISSILLTFLSFAYFKDKSFSIGQFLEYSSQMLLPLFFIIKEKKVLFLKLIIAVTFCAHGLYAIGYYPVPAKFIQMVIMAFHCSNQDALLILKIAGILDFIFAVAIFIPVLSRSFLIYGVIWGFLTAFARIYTNFYSEFAFSTFSYWLYEFVVRIPHFIIPLLLIKPLKKDQMTTSLG